MSDPQKVKVTFASDYTPTGGTGVYEGGETYSVEPADARLYVNIGKATLADQSTRAHTGPTEPAAAATSSKATPKRASRAKAATKPAETPTTSAAADAGTDADKAGS